MTPPAGAFPAWFAPVLDVLDSARAHDLSLFTPPRDRPARPSAVLILLGEGPAGPDVLLTERAATLRSHAGQVAFPGGALDPGDAGPVEAALREAREETGLDPAGVRVAGMLPELYLPVSDFAVTPVLAWWSQPSPVAPADPAEVARVARVPLAELTDPGRRFRVTHPSGYTGPGFEVGGLFVWGFTAGLLDRLIHLTGWERPWDVTRERPLPLNAVGRRPAGGPAARTAPGPRPSPSGPALSGRAPSGQAPPSPSLSSQPSRESTA